MWFLTQEGMDRYDGKRIRHYTVLDGNLKVAPQVNLNWLYTDTENTLWVVGRKGRIFHYDTLHDRFRMYNPQIEMFARFKMKSSFHKTKRII